MPSPIDLSVAPGLPASVLEACPIPVAVVTAAGALCYVNQRLEAVFGHARSALIGRPLAELESADGSTLAAALQRYRTERAQDPDSHVAEFVARCADGSQFDADASLFDLELEGETLIALWISGSAQRKRLDADLAEARQQQQRLVRLSRVHALLSAINALIVRTPSRRLLFEQACRIAVDSGGFALAWIGVPVNGQLRPVAVHGAAATLLDELPMDLATLEGDGSLARELRDGAPWISNDLRAAPLPPAWRRRLLDAGLQAGMAYPLFVGRELVGCLTLYAQEPGVFDAEEMALLAELARNLCYALEFIARDEQLDYLAYFDPLTRLANRKLFYERLNQQVQAAHQGKTRFAVMFFDLANFKAINDTIGWSAGDELLKAAAERLVRFVGAASLVARVGGDRFGAVLADVHESGKLARLLGVRLAEHATQPYLVNVGGTRQELRLDTRVGVAVYPEDGEDAEALARNGEQALNKARASGERYLFYTREMGETTAQKVALEARLQLALERDEFVLYYQPRLDLRSNTISGVEALLRWSSPELGLVPPARFIPLLEETGLIVEVGAWAIRRAAADLRRWSDWDLAPPPMAVNVSPLQLRRPGLIDEVRAALNSGGPRARLELEVTESTLMTDIDQNIERLRALRELGVDIAIDDFGTGYSSLAYLARLPVSSVKIDRSFVSGMTDSADSVTIISTIISLGHSMKLKVVAEGVDAPEQLKFLRLLKCDEIQGFLFSKPLPADGLVQLLRESGSGQRPLAA